jgi:hypothetical protein
MSWKSHLYDKQPYFEFDENNQKVLVEDIRKAKSLEELKGIGIPDSVIGAMKSSGVRPNTKHMNYMPEIWLFQNEDLKQEKPGSEYVQFELGSTAHRIAK